MPGVCRSSILSWQVVSIGFFSAVARVTFRVFYGQMAELFQQKGEACPWVVAMKLARMRLALPILLLLSVPVAASAFVAAGAVVIAASACLVARTRRTVRSTIKPQALHEFFTMEMEGPEAAAMRGGIPGVRPVSFQPPDFESRKLQFDSALARRQGVPYLEDDEIGVVFADEAGGAADELAFDDSFVFTRKRNPMGVQLLGNDALDLSGARRKKRGPPLGAMLGVQDSSDLGSTRDDETVCTERRGPPTMPALS